MTFNEYQNSITKYRFYPDSQYLTYPVLGLCGESGEIAEKVKKLLRKKGEVDDNFRAEILLESGDVLWYLGDFNQRLNISLDDVAAMNILKHESRKTTGKDHALEFNMALERIRR